MNSEVINHPDYYRLPCGRDLEDYIFHRRLTFAEGSALKYLWRAGKKDGESREKDLAKYEHYVRFIARSWHEPEDKVRLRIEFYRKDAEGWAP